MKNRTIQMMVSLAAFFTAGSAFAEEMAAGSSTNTAAIGAFLALGIAAAGGALGQAKAAAAALEGIARNPSAADKLFVPMIIGLALIESLVLYCFVIAFVKA